MCVFKQPPLHPHNLVLHVQQGQHLAEAMVQEFDLPADSAVRAFSTLGLDGSSRAERDMHRWMRGAFGVDLPITTVPITVKDIHATTGTIEIQHPVILPKHMVAALWKAGPEVFAQSMVGRNGFKSLLEFWKNYADKAWVRDHPHLQDPETGGAQFPCGCTGMRRGRSKIRSC